METGGGAEGTVQATGSAVILRVLRVALHVGFAVLLAVAMVRQILGASGSTDVVALILAVILAAVYLTGTILEKRFTAVESAFNPHPYAHWWLTAVCGLWLALIWVSADFVWLAFPIFFLQLHLLPRKWALLAVAASTLLAIAALGNHSGGFTVPMVLGPVFGAAFAVVTGLAYQALYLEAENQRLAAEELRRTRAELASTQHAAGVLAERERLAREIHDTLAQGLSSIVLMGRSAESSLAAGELEQARARLQTVQSTASENLAEARNFVRGLQSPQLQARSLVDSLERLCARTQQEAHARGKDLECRFRLEGIPIELPNPSQTTLLRAAQASLANVWTHAKASAAVVTLSFLDTEVTLDVFDDGAGFDPLATAAEVARRADGSGVGLASLRERAKALGGTLNVESSPGEGTVIAVRLPLVDGPAEEHCGPAADAEEVSR
ncbi:sensor histidine kinase [Pseudarthrobacter sp. J1738]|uniref:sensor histidine kinase n=1 Tax=unclassified Pseudarthrobacter TaxID=2647000 RepID=UPI003D276BE9